MKHKDLYFLLFMALILVVLWVTFSIYHNLVSSTISEPLNISISAIQPTFNQKTIDELKKRKEVAPLYIFQPQTTPLSSESAEEVITQ